MVYKLITTAHPDGIINCELTQEVEDRRNTIMQWVMDTREDQTRQALIELGWTPPDE